MGAEMHFIERFSRWEGIIFGFIIGVTATVVGSMAYNEINGMLRISHLKRSLHNNQLEEIAARRPLPVLVEKPVFTDPGDLPRLEALARDYPALVWVAMEYRYMPPVAALIAQAEQATGGSGAADEDVVDADFEEVKEEDKK